MQLWHPCPWRNPLKHVFLFSIKLCKYTLFPRNNCCYSGIWGPLHTGVHILRVFNYFEICFAMNSWMYSFQILCGLWPVRVISTYNQGFEHMPYISNGATTHLILIRCLLQNVYSHITLFHYVATTWQTYKKLRADSQETLPPAMTKISLKITCLKCFSNLTGANELRMRPWWIIYVYINIVVVSNFPDWHYRFVHVTFRCSCLLGH